MRKMIFIFLIAIFIPMIAWAAPYLGCTLPPPEEQVQGARGMVDGIPFDTPYTVRKDQNGTDYLMVYDIGTLSAAKHTFTDIRLYNIRGQSDPVPFDLPQIPGSALNIGLRP